MISRTLAYRETKHDYTYLKPCFGQAMRICEHMRHHPSFQDKSPSTLISTKGNAKQIIALLRSIILTDIILYYLENSQLLIPKFIIPITYVLKRQENWIVYKVFMCIIYNIGLYFLLYKKYTPTEIKEQRIYKEQNQSEKLLQFLPSNYFPQGAFSRHLPDTLHLPAPRTTIWASSNYLIIMFPTMWFSRLQAGLLFLTLIPGLLSIPLRTARTPIGDGALSQGDRRDNVFSLLSLSPSPNHISTPAILGV